MGGPQREHMGTHRTLSCWFYPSSLGCRLGPPNIVHDVLTYLDEDPLRDHDQLSRKLGRL